MQVLECQAHPTGQVDPGGDPLSVDSPAGSCLGARPARARGGTGAVRACGGAGAARARGGAHLGAGGRGGPGGSRLGEPDDRDVDVERGEGRCDDERGAGVDAGADLGDVLIEERSGGDDAGVLELHRQRAAHLDLPVLRLGRCAHGHKPGRLPVQQGRAVVAEVPDGVEHPGAGRRGDGAAAAEHPRDRRDRHARRLGDILQPNSHSASLRRAQRRHSLRARRPGQGFRYDGSAAAVAAAWRPAGVREDT